MTLISHRLLVLTILAITCSCLQAERSIRAIYFQRPASAPKKLLLYDGENTLEVNLPSMNLSERVKLPVGDLKFQCLATPPVEGEEIPPGAPLIKIGQGWKDVILLISRNRTNKNYPYFVMALDASASKFAPGEILCFNRTTAILGGRMGSKKFRLNPKKTLLIKDPAKDLSDYRVVINYMMPGWKKSRPLTRTTWRHEPTVRQLLFVVYDPVRKLPRIWSIPDRMPTPEEPEEPAEVKTAGQL